MPEGWGRRNYINVSEKVEFTPAEMGRLQAIARAEPDLARKIIGRNNEMAEAIARHNKLANKFNRDLLRKIGYSEEEAARMEPEPRSP